MLPQIHLLFKAAIDTLRNELKAHMADELVKLSGTEVQSNMIIQYMGPLVGAGQKHPLNRKTGQPDLSFALCDGAYYTAPDGRSVQTPNLIGRFMMGAAVGHFGVTGGGVTHTHTASADGRTLSYYQMAAHNHVQQGSRSGSSVEPLYYKAGKGTINNLPCLNMATEAWSTSTGLGGYDRDYLLTYNAGTSDPHNHAVAVGDANGLPPYIGMYYLMKL